MNDTPSSTDAQAVQAEFDALPGRLAQVLAFTGISQAEMARRVGMSAGFISDVMRGVKRPGPEFLLALRMSLGISVDWLLSGQGTMTGGSGIRQDLLQTIRIQVAVARAAVLMGDATAKALLTLIQEGRLDLTANVYAFRALLDKVAPPDEDLDLVILDNSLGLLGEANRGGEKQQKSAIQNGVSRHDIIQGLVRHRSPNCGRPKNATAEGKPDVHSPASLSWVRLILREARLAVAPVDGEPLH